MVEKGSIARRRAASCCLGVALLVAGDAVGGAVKRGGGGGGEHARLEELGQDDGKPNVQTGGSHDCGLRSARRA